MSPPWLVPVEVPGPVDDGSLAVLPEELPPDTPGPVMLSEPEEVV